MTRLISDSEAHAGLMDYDVDYVEPVGLIVIVSVLLADTVPNPDEWDGATYDDWLTEMRSVAGVESDSPSLGFEFPVPGRMVVTLERF